MKKKNLMNDALDRVADVFDLPGEVVAGAPRITITGCRRIFIESHRGILEYGENEIDINGGRVVIKIRGDKLRLCSMNDGELLITGELSGMELVR